VKTLVTEERLVIHDLGGGKYTVWIKDKTDHEMESVASSEPSVSRETAVAPQIIILCESEDRPAMDLADWPLIAQGVGEAIAEWHRRFPS
jgi:hypothetical protein